MQSISAFLDYIDIAKFADFRWKNANVSRTQGMRHVIHIFFGSSSGKDNCAKFHYCRICVVNFRDSPALLREQPQKGSSRIGLKDRDSGFHFSSKNSPNQAIKQVCLRKKLYYKTFTYPIENLFHFFFV